MTLGADFNFSRKRKPKRPVSRQSGGTSGDLTVDNWVNETPIVPYTPPAASPPPSVASLFRRPTPRPASTPGSSLTDLAGKYLLQSLNDLLTPGPTTRQIAEAASRLGVKPVDPYDEPFTDEQLHPTDPKAAAPSRNLGLSSTDNPDLTDYRVDLQVALRDPRFTPAQRRKFRAMASEARGWAQEEAPGRSAASADPATAVISSVPGRGPVAAPGPSQAEKRQAVKNLRRAQRRATHSGAPISALAAQFPELSPRWLRALGAAQRKTGTPAALLAGILSQESDFGRSTLPGVHSGSNFAGAAGPFQIGNGTGAAGNWWGENMPASSNIYDVEDAAMGAGKYLQEVPSTPATKNPATWYDAAFSYNHADWYAQDVVREATKRIELNKLGRPPDPEALQVLEKAKADAREVGLDPAAILGLDKGLGKPPPKMVSKFRAGMQAAEELAKADIPYVWGGGHGGIDNNPTGLDCSGAVSWVLNKMGVLDAPLVSGAMGQVLEPGPGAVTVYYNGGHTFMKIGNKFFGTSVNDSSKGLDFYPKPSDAYLSTYKVGHVPGLDEKVARQMGIDPSTASAGFSEGGISYSADGTEATVTGGASQGAAGYSDRPISPFAGGAEVPISELLQTLTLEPQLGGPAEDEESLIDRILAGGRL